MVGLFNRSLLLLLIINLTIRLDRLCLFLAALLVLHVHCLGLSPVYFFNLNFLVMRLIMKLMIVLRGSIFGRGSFLRLRSRLRKFRLELCFISIRHWCWFNFALGSAVVDTVFVVVATSLIEAILVEEVVVRIVEGAIG